MNNTSIIYGFGFFAAQVKMSALKKFVCNHSKTIEELGREDALELLKYAKSPDCKEENLENIPVCWEGTSNENVRAIIAYVISRETEVQFDYEDGQYHGEKAAILITARLPWQFNTKDITHITQEKIYDLLKPYIHELDLNTQPDYIQIEYYG